MRSVKLDPSATPTRTKLNYYDSSAVHEVFGEDAKDRYMDETDGLGTARKDRQGNVWHQDRHSRDWERLSDEEVDRVYLAGDTEHEAE